MKKITLFILFTFGLINAQENIIKNPGFEIRTGEPQADDWISPSGVDRYKGVQKTGEYSMRMTSQQGFLVDMYQDGYTDSDIGVYVYHKVTPETYYTLTYWVLDDTEKAELWHKVVWLDKNRNPIPVTVEDPLANPTETSVNHNEWKEVKATSKSPENAKYISIKFYIGSENENSGGSIFIDELSFIKGGTSSVNDIKWENHAICYYNPSSQTVNVKVQGDIIINNIEIYNTLGQKIIESYKTHMQNEVELNINNSIKEGIYIVRISTNKGNYTKKILIRNK